MRDAACLIPQRAASRWVKQTRSVRAITVAAPKYDGI
jgi:hypothetical protein